MQPHAARGEQQHERVWTLGRGARCQRRKRIAMPLPDRSAQEALVLRRDENVASLDARAPGDDAVIVARRDAESREVGTRTDRRVERERARIGQHIEPCARFERGERDAVHRVV